MKARQKSTGGRIEQFSSFIVNTLQKLHVLNVPQPKNLKYNDKAQYKHKLSIVKIKCSLRIKWNYHSS